jgi:hypothetical protein
MTAMGNTPSHTLSYTSRRQRYLPDQPLIGVADDARAAQAALLERGLASAIDVLGLLAWIRIQDFRSLSRCGSIRT